MVGEDTVKTNSRFYFTRTPDSVPGSLNAVTARRLQQTREADLYATTGTRNYWPAEMAPYMQGSDHDVFLGLGIPSTMLGHDPDWTHHSSEDTVDKTDASEFRRVGVLASAAAYSGATGSLQSDGPARQESLGNADNIGERARRIGEILAEPVSSGNRQQLRENLDAMSGMLEQQQHSAAALLHEDGTTSGNVFEIKRAESQTKKGAGPVAHRLTLLPVYEETFEHLSAADLRWWNTQQAVFSNQAAGGGLPTGPNLDLIVYEAINFMDGKRTNSEIAALLSAEYHHDFDAAWMDQLAAILERLQVVGQKQ